MPANGKRDLIRRLKVNRPSTDSSREGKTAKTWSLPITSTLGHGSERVEETYGPTLTP